MPPEPGRVVVPAVQRQPRDFRARWAQPVSRTVLPYPAGAQTSTSPRPRPSSSRSVSRGRGTRSGRSSGMWSLVASSTSRPDAAVCADATADGSVIADPAHSPPPVILFLADGRACRQPSWAAAATLRRFTARCSHQHSTPLALPDDARLTWWPSRGGLCCGASAGSCRDDQQPQPVAAFFRYHAEQGREKVLGPPSSGSGGAAAAAAGR